MPVFLSECHAAQVGPYVGAPDDDHHGQQHPSVEVSLRGKYYESGQGEGQGDVHYGGQYKRRGAVGISLAGIQHGDKYEGDQHRQHQQPFPL